jgi:hypothetical protein
MASTKGKSAWSQELVDAEVVEVETVLVMMNSVDEELTEQRPAR